jgi:transcription elongation factor GreA
MRQSHRPQGRFRFLVVTMGAMSIMSEQVQYLTSDGYKELETRLDYLRNEKRAEVAARLHQALEEGGELVENAEYEDAKNEQAFVEGEIMRLETILSNAKIIEHASGKKATVSLGDTVTLKEKGQKKTEVFQLVGAAESDPREGRISNESPLGRALLGRKVGDMVTVHAPDGEIGFEIKKIQ